MCLRSANSSNVWPFFAGMRFCGNRRVSHVLNLLWGLVYALCGAIQFVAGIYFMLDLPIFQVMEDWLKGGTTLQSKMNAKLSPQRFWACHENELIKTIQTIPHNPYVSFKSASLNCGLRFILVQPNPQ